MGWVESLRADDVHGRGQEPAVAPDELVDDDDDDAQVECELDADESDRADVGADRVSVMGRKLSSSRQGLRLPGGRQARRNPLGRKTVVLVAGGLACLLVIIVLGAKAVVDGFTGGSSTDPTRSLVVGSCPDAVAAPEERSTLVAAVARFEQAYYSRDEKSLLATLSPSSALREQNWKDVLTTAAPQGTRWCATVTPTAADSVVTVVVSSKTPDGDLAVYASTVTGERVDGLWEIAKFETAISKPGAPGAVKEKE